MLALTLRNLFRFALWLLTERQLEGLDNIPDPPYIFAINHLGLFDVPLVYGHVGGPHIIGWAAEKYEYHPIFGPLLRAGGAIFIQRGLVDRQALDAAVRAIKNGKAFGMAPEGTRSESAELARGKTGVAYLAAESGAPVVPAAITGTEKVGRELRRLRRPTLTMRIAPPLELPPVSDQQRSKDLRRNADEVMCRIAAMLPPSYRGVYADHPRTHALLDADYGPKRPVPLDAET